MSDERLRLEDEGRGFFLVWNGGTLFTCVKQNGQVLGRWNEDREPTSEEAERILQQMRDTGEYLNIIE